LSESPRSARNNGVIRRNTGVRATAWARRRVARSGSANTAPDLRPVQEPDVLFVAGASGDLGYIVGIEHSSVSIGGAEPEAYELRVTTICRRENGEWKVVHRHADPKPDSDAARRQASRLGG
jgi:hypothetical protein